MIQKTLVISIFFLLTANFIYGEGVRESEVIQRHYAFSEFDSVLVNGAFRVRIIKSENWDIHISFVTEDQNNIKLRKNSNVFEISMNPDRIPGLPTPVVILSMPELISLNLSGAVQMEAGGFSSDKEFEVVMNPGVFLNLNGFECSSVYFTLAGPCELHSFLSACDIYISNTGSSIVRMGGRAENLTIISNGRARIDGSLLLVDNVNLNLEEISEIRITPDNQLTISSVDKAIIYYSDKYMDNPVINEGSAILRKY